jgi:hypothetical protein
VQPISRVLVAHVTNLTPPGSERAPTAEHVQPAAAHPPDRLVARRERRPPLHRLVVLGTHAAVLAILQADSAPLRVVRVSASQRALAAVEMRGADEASQAHNHKLPAAAAARWHRTRLLPHHEGRCGSVGFGFLFVGFGFSAAAAAHAARVEGPQGGVGASPGAAPHAEPPLEREQHVAGARGGAGVRGAERQRYTLTLKL